MLLLPICFFIPKATLGKYLFVDDELLFQVLIGLNPFRSSSRCHTPSLSWRDIFAWWLCLVSRRLAAMLNEFASFDFDIFVLLALMIHLHLITVGLLRGIEVLRKLCRIQMQIPTFCVGIAMWIMPATRSGILCFNVVKGRVVSLSINLSCLSLVLDQILRILVLFVYEVLDL